MWERIYQAPNSQHWVGRQDALPHTCLFQVMQCVDLRHAVPKQAGSVCFALLGFACDEGVKRNQGRVGAKGGPNAIRQVLGALPIKRFPITLYDVGNLCCDDGDLEGAQTVLGEVVLLLLKQGITPIVLGGGHELAFGHYQGIDKMIQDRHLGIVNFDAHFDMRPLLADKFGSSGSPFLQIADDRLSKRLAFDYTCIGVQASGNSHALEQTANNHHVQAIHAERIHEDGLSVAKTMLQGVVARCDAIYVSLCLDVFASPFAPGVSAPQILGLLPWQVLTLLRELNLSKKVMSYDIAEYNPTFDIDSCTAKLAASLIYTIIHHHAV